MVKHKYKIIICLILSLLSFMYFIVSRKMGLPFSTSFFILAIFFLMLAIIYYKLYDKIKNSKFSFIIIISRIVMLAIIASFIIIAGAAFYTGTKTEAEHGKYIIILGAKVNDKTPSLVLKQRLDAAIPIINANSDMKVVVSGGQGAGESISEALSMKNYLINKGIDENRILSENRSTSTMENLMYSKLIIEKDRKASVDNTQVTIVTSNFHVFRAHFLSKRAGFDAHMIPSPIYNTTIPSSYFREYFGIIKSFIFDKQDKYNISNDSVTTDDFYKTKDKATENTDVNKDNDAVGKVTGSFKGVNVYSNGKSYTKSYGKSFSDDGYYFGYKWQCIEYIKRFYYEVYNFKMPDGYGNAKDFFDTSLSDGQLNKKRGLIQYKNGSKTSPKIGDIIVFNDTIYGHVAIISDVGDDYIELTQQNVYKKPKQKYTLKVTDGNYYVGDTRKPAGWLALK